jgi:hypothetical protein
MAYIIGRGRYAREAYPQSPGAGGGASAGGRNSARGPAAPVAIDTAGTAVPWTSIESTGAAGTDIPVTPQSTRRFQISAMLTVSNVLNAFSGLTIHAKVNGVTVATPFTTVDVPPNSTPTAIPFLIETNGLSGSPVVFEIFMTAQSEGAITLIADQSAVQIQELSGAAG